MSNDFLCAQLLMDRLRGIESRLADLEQKQETMAYDISQLEAAVAQQGVLIQQQGDVITNISSDVYSLVALVQEANEKIRVLSQPDLAFKQRIADVTAQALDNIQKAQANLAKATALDQSYPPAPPVDPVPPVDPAPPVDPSPQPEPEPQPEPVPTPEPVPEPEPETGN